MWLPTGRDPDDNMVLETAASDQADTIVTFNVRNFIQVAGRFGITVLAPRQAMWRLEVQLPPQRLHEIIRGERAITPDAALRLARFFGTSAETRMSLQIIYDIAIARNALGKPHRARGGGSLDRHENPIADMAAFVGDLMRARRASAKHFGGHTRAGCAPRARPA